jgi:hypothetical protein
MTLARDYVLASYTLSKSMDTGSTEVGLGSNTAGYTQVLAESVAELRVPPLAPSDFDARHTFSTALSGETGRSGIRPIYSFVIGGSMRFCGGTRRGH